jgi:phosphate acyltransferase
LARIALDAMGGDHAPAAPVAGALLALAEHPEHRIQLVGDPEAIARTLDSHLAGEYAAHGAHRARLDIVPAAQAIDMTDKPSAVLRGKPDSSMHVGLRLQTAGESDAFVSAGNTGAQMAVSSLVVVMDSGANVDCSAAELVQFARIGAVYAEDLLGRQDPVVALLSIGEEAEKGNAVVKEAHQLLLASGLNFQGNVEGRDLPVGASDRGPFDVVVCDGFVGNVLLKFYEAVAPFLFGLVARHAGLSRAQLAGAFKELDYSEHGGAPLLGVKGVSIICHGKSDPRALKNAVHIAARAVESRMSDHIGRRLEEAVRP